MIKFMLPKQIPLKVYANAETRDRCMTDKCMHTVNIPILWGFFGKGRHVVL